MLKTLPSRGFTLIELMVGLTLIGIVMMLGAPTLATYLQNSKVASTASTFYSGVQLARAEAIRRNAPAQFVMTDAMPATDAAATSAATAPNGRNWFVRATGALGFELVEAKSGSEGGGTAATPAVQVAGSVVGGVFDGVVPFNGFGATGTGSEYVIDIENPTAGACAPAGPIRCRRIRVLPGGQIVSCDRTIAAAGDTRGC